MAITLHLFIIILYILAGHEARLGKALLEEFVERVQLFYSPVLFRPHFAEEFTKLHKPHIPLLLFRLFSAQDLVDLA